MLEIKRIITSDEYYPFIEKLMETAFPIQERRDAFLQQEYIANNNNFYNNIILDQQQPVGLITFWDLNSFFYIEHFAIDDRFRNKGIGAKVIEQLIKALDKPIVLEAEEPIDDLTNRRIKFYERMGFNLEEGFNYLQPPYREGDQWFPLKLMTYGKAYTTDELETCKRKIHKEVYNA